MHSQFTRKRRHTHLNALAHIHIYQATIKLFTKVFTNWVIIQHCTIHKGCGSFSISNFMQNGFKPFGDNLVLFKYWKLQKCCLQSCRGKKCSVLNNTNNKNAWLEITTKNNTNSNCKADWPALLPFSLAMERKKITCLEWRDAYRQGVQLGLFLSRKAGPTGTLRDWRTWGTGSQPAGWGGRGHARCLIPEEKTDNNKMSEGFQNVQAICYELTAHHVMVFLGSSSPCFTVASDAVSPACTVAYIPVTHTLSLSGLSKYSIMGEPQNYCNCTNRTSQETSSDLLPVNTSLEIWKHDLVFPTICPPFFLDRIKTQRKLLRLTRIVISWLELLFLFCGGGQSQGVGPCWSDLCRSSSGET